MEHSASIFLRWAGRLLILLAVFILAASLFFPDAVSPLGSVVCPEGTELSNTRYTPPNAPSNEDLELVCTSRTYTESVAQDILLIAGGLGVVGIIAIWFSGRVARTRTRLPDVPAAR
ncbi:MAG TPA: hypothetical protein VNS19_12955 [Acidimicrobiales bacterium]|jgi:hypothetical protein|nr:hypothetical protein [Acidimicrobiales bacterium]